MKKRYFILPIIIISILVIPFIVLAISLESENKISNLQNSYPTLASGKCVITPGIFCDDYLVKYLDGYNDRITLDLRNGIGDDIYSVNVIITTPAVIRFDGGEVICTLSCVTGCMGTESDTMPADVLTTWRSDDCGDGYIGIPGSLFKADIVFDYVGVGGLPHTKTGYLKAYVD